MQHFPCVMTINRSLKTSSALNCHTAVSLPCAVSFFHPSLPRTKNKNARTIDALQFCRSNTMSSCVKVAVLSRMSFSCQQLRRSVWRSMDTVKKSARPSALTTKSASKAKRGATVVVDPLFFFLSRWSPWRNTPLASACLILFCRPSTSNR